MQQGGFEYTSAPHAAPMRNKPKYRPEENNASGPQNIMADARVVRGNTYAAKVLSSGLQKELSKSGRPNKSKPGNFPMRRANTPPAVDGRTHMTQQTEDYLEEITDRPIEQDAEVQTVAALDRPASPLFVRAKIGFDAGTQIDNGDLFNFDIEVEPLLEVLVGKTIHVSMLELMQEEELEAIRSQQEEYETIRNIELAEVQRLEAEIKRKANEQARRIAQEKKRLEDRRKLEELVAARQFSNQFLGELHINVFEVLEAEGAFYDPVQKEVEDIFLPALFGSVARGADAYEAASLIATELLEAARARARAFEIEAVRQRKEHYAKLAAEEAERRRVEEEARLAAEAAARAAAEAEGGGEES